MHRRHHGFFTPFLTDTLPLHIICYRGIRHEDDGTAGGHGHRKKENEGVRLGVALPSPSSIITSSNNQCHAAGCCPPPPPPPPGSIRQRCHDCSAAPCTYHGGGERCRHCRRPVEDWVSNCGMGVEGREEGCHVPREFRYIQDPDLIPGVPLPLPSAWMVLLFYPLSPPAVSPTTLLSPAPSLPKPHSTSTSPSFPPVPFLM